ncbi:MAG: hypothetical protein JWO11_4098 [Nocardioides sp.]|nr:hypothetical protein [Nocardioides sp.]
MRHDEFIAKVAQRADVSAGAAEALTAATLKTLAERISGGEAADLASQLPKELQPHLIAAEETAERFGVDEFIRRVADRAGTDPDSALKAQGAVFATIREAVSPGELDDIASQLPDDLRRLLGSNG